MSRQKVSSQGSLKVEYSERLAPGQAREVIRLVVSLIRERNFEGHAKMGENNLSLDDDLDSTQKRIDARGGTNTIDFVVASKPAEATIFADFDTGQLEFKTVSKTILDEIIREWKTKSRRSEHVK